MERGERMTASLSAAFEQVNLNLDKLNRYLSRGSIYLRAFFLTGMAIVIFLERLHYGGMVMSSLEKAASACTKPCESAEYFKKMYNSARQVRDRLADVLEKTPSLPSLALFRYLIDRELAWWDELAENLYIASNSELSSLMRTVLERA